MRSSLFGWLCALGLAACGVVPEAPGGPASRAAGAPAASLHGTRWVGVVAGSADARTLPRLEFVAAGRVTGYTGCNMLSGSWTADGSGARMGPLVTTKRMCVGPAGDVEKRFVQALAPGGRVVREGDKLVAVGPDGARFEFTEAAAS